MAMGRVGAVRGRLGAAVTAPAGPAMNGPEARLLARIKLAELRRQRDRLEEHYAAVERRAAAAGTPAERLRALYDGLREARFAGKPLHPDVDNLNAVLLA